MDSDFSLASKINVMVKEEQKRVEEEKKKKSEEEEQKRLKRMEGRGKDGEERILTKEEKE